jgi:hypothetical protein
LKKWVHVVNSNFLLIFFLSENSEKEKKRAIRKTRMLGRPRNVAGAGAAVIVLTTSATSTLA